MKTLDVAIFMRTKDGWIVNCNCGFNTRPRYTFEAAGREFDLHLAERFPIGTERGPCTGGSV